MSTETTTVYCNYCAAYVHTSEITFKDDIHWHSDTDEDGTNTHDIAEEYDLKKDTEVKQIMALLEPVSMEHDTGAYNTYYDTRCGDVLHGKTPLGNPMQHICYKEAGHKDQHQCFMAPNACENKGW